MDKYCNVAIVGFFGSGSSAATDLLKEYTGVSIALNKDERGIERPYEHKLLYTNSGVFDTAALLKGNNTAYSSDMYINNFLKKMNRLYKYNFVSFGSYKQLLGDEFWKSVLTFVDDIGAKRLSSGISRTEHKKAVRYSPTMALLQLSAKIAFKKPVYKYGKLNIMSKDPYYFAMPSASEVNESVRDFIRRYFEMCYIPESKVMIYDQLVHAQHCGLIDDYFDENFRAIIIKRDPRDLYCLSKYIWSKPPQGFSAPLPVDIEQFCDFWRKTISYSAVSDKVLSINFEDLIYCYEETVRRIEEFLNLKPEDHIDPKNYFDPNKSIANTQIFTRSEEMMKDAKTIEALIPELLYTFPYETHYTMNDIFEDTNEVRGKKTNGN